MDTLLAQLKKDIKDAEKKCKSLGVNTSEYHFWNGCRCQAEVILKLINSNS